MTSKEQFVEKLKKESKIFISKGEIREYATNIDLKTNLFNKGLCLTLENSNSDNTHVIICPIYKCTNENKVFGINIGELEINGIKGEYVASIPEIKLISKRRFVFPNIKRYPLRTKLDSFISYKIIALYKSFITKYRQINKYNENIRQC